MTVTREQDPGALRAAMVASLREQGLVHSDEVAAALLAVPRHEFAPGEPLKKAYDTHTTLVPVRAKDGTELSVVSASHIQAIMLEQAGIKPQETRQHHPMTLRHDSAYPDGSSRLRLWFLHANMIMRRPRQSPQPRRNPGTRAIPGQSLIGGCRIRRYRADQEFKRTRF
jgi:hypothetical protein